ncbi:hypothetical protein WMF30_27770 [Sorangium sp. So ce134]
MNRDAIEYKGGATIAASLAIAALGGVAALIGGFVDLRRFFFSYLAAWSFAVFLSVGALVTLLTCNAMRAGWPTAVRRLLETMVAPLPLLAALFVPILVGLDTLYPWMHPERIAEEHARRILEHRAPYFNPAFFVVRSVIYFAVWIAVALVLRRRSFAQDREPRADVKDPMYGLSGAMLPVVAITIVFSSFDWLMSLEATWYSTMFPVYVFASAFVTAVGALTVLSYAAQTSGYLARLNDSHYYALGRLLLAFTIFWAYAAYFQFMLIWIANKPDEVSFFLDRWAGPWRPTSVLVVLTRFVVPFLILMSYAIKRRPRRLSRMALWVVASGYIDFHWLVVPATGRHGFAYHWLDLAMLGVVGGLSTAFAAWRLRGRPVVPVHDPRLEEAFAYRSV